MYSLAGGLDYVDLNFLGRPQIIATAVLRGAGGVSLVDPGPTTTLPGLIKALETHGITANDVRQVLLTHIHLDHAGATGSLLKLNPAIEVFVHEHGAKHMVDPSKLIASATRLYGQDLERLWGDFVPVPAAQIRVLKGGERIEAGGRDLEVAATPGHAIHHVTYFDASSRVAFVGDVAGIRRGSGTYILPPTPPPDIDLGPWRSSADRILAWDPDTLFLTHFGPYGGARPHFQQLFDRIDIWSALVRKLLADEAIDDQEREKRFVAAALDDIRRTIGEVEAEHYSRAGRLDYSWQGLSRYWRRNPLKA
jgi:glyoxylase-like metal-dependent hydrolase (beta-lactamase superfamily II)